MSFMGTMVGKKAVAAHRKGNYAEAESLYREAVQKGLDNPAMYGNFVVLLVRAGKLDEALEMIKKMEKLHGLNDHDKLTMKTQYAIILWKKGHLDHAIEILEDEAATMKNGTLYSIIGYLLIEQGNAEKALKFNLETLDYDDSDPIFIENVAMCYYRLLGDKEAAKPYFEKALRLKPTAIDTNYFLALYDIDDGNIEAAREKLRLSSQGRTSPLNYATPELITEKMKEIGL